MSTIFRSHRVLLAAVVALLALSTATAATTATRSPRQHAHHGQKKRNAKLRAFEAVGDAPVSLPTQAIADPANTPIATLDLPAGSYVITAKAFMHNDVPANTTAANNNTCTLQAGNDADSIQFDLFPPKIGDDSTEISTIVHTFKTRGTVTWRCNQSTPGTNVMAINRKITAIGVSSISQTQLP